MLFSNAPALYCRLYKVKGKNPETGRQKTAEVVAASNEKEKDFAIRSGLLSPFEVSPGEREITEGQREAAKKYKVKFPKDASLADASLLLSRRIDQKGHSGPVPKKAILFAVQNGVFIPKYANAAEAEEILIDSLPKLKAEIKKLFK